MRFLDRRARVALAATLLAPAVLVGTASAVGAVPATTGTGHLPTAASPGDPDGQWWDYDGASAQGQGPGAASRDDSDRGDDTGSGSAGRDDVDVDDQQFSDEEAFADDRESPTRDTLGPQRREAEEEAGAPASESRTQRTDGADDSRQAPRDARSDDEFRVETPNKQFDESAGRSREGRSSGESEDEVLAREAKAAGMTVPADDTESEAQAENEAAPEVEPAKKQPAKKAAKKAEKKAEKKAAKPKSDDKSKGAKKKR